MTFFFCQDEIGKSFATIEEIKNWEENEIMNIWIIFYRIYDSELDCEYDIKI